MRPRPQVPGHPKRPGQSQLHRVTLNPGIARSSSAMPSSVTLLPPKLPIFAPEATRATYNSFMRKTGKPSLAFWATILVVTIPLLYVLSFSVACWLVDCSTLPAWETARVYRPLIRGANCDFWPIAIPLRRYGELLLPASHLTPNDSNVVDVMDMLLNFDDVATKHRRSPG